MHYQNPISIKANDKETVGVLITNVGTPDAPTKEALKPYLKAFLLDTRVVEPPPARWLWKLILNTMILNTRPAKSAIGYKEVWGTYGAGSPLLDIGTKQLTAIEKIIRPLFKGQIEFALGMGYGKPSIASAMQELANKGCTKFIILPLFPQYTSVTTGSTFDALSKELQSWRWVPELRFLSAYYQEPLYIASLASSVQEHQQVHGKPDLLIISFHGIPQRYSDDGDPYFEQCHKTAKLLAEKLSLTETEYQVTFQSLFGDEEWLKPYTDATLKELPSRGVKHLQVICPGFSADCLETIEEIDQENREYFENAGGTKFSYIPALNDRQDHTEALSKIVLDNLQGW